MIQVQHSTANFSLNQIITNLWVLKQLLQVIPWISVWGIPVASFRRSYQVVEVELPGTFEVQQVLGRFTNPISNKEIIVLLIINNASRSHFLAPRGYQLNDVCQVRIHVAHGRRFKECNLFPKAVNCREGISTGPPLLVVAGWLPDPRA